MKQTKKYSSLDIKKLELEKDRKFWPGSDLEELKIEVEDLKKRLKAFWVFVILIFIWLSGFLSGWVVYGF